jgi:AcrR family transcriptional regulator
VDTLASRPANLESDDKPHFEGSPDEGEVAVPLSDLLDQRRPHRADAARIFVAILAAARAGFTDSGTEASLENIARRAGVGPATLYRNFPTREDLIEAVYVAEVDSLCQDAVRLAETEKPWPALVAWIRHFVTYMATKRVLLDALDRESGAFRACRQALYDFGGPLLTRAQESGDANPDMSIDDVMRFVIGVTSSPFGSNDQRERILDMAIAGIATQSTTRGRTSAKSPAAARAPISRRARSAR